MIPLHVHSYYSLLEGVISPDDIVEKTSAKYIEAYEKLTGRKFELPV